MPTPMRIIKLSSVSLLLLAGMLYLISCRDGKRYHETTTQPAAKEEAPTTGTAAILTFQKSLNATFTDPDASPLSPKQRNAFEGLEFFPPDTAYQVQARLVRSPDALPFEMPTTTGQSARERKYGTLYFEVEGQACSLQVYQSPELMLQEGYEDYLFLPFTDQTNGVETYEGGRYIDLRIPDADSLLLDFNRAYNPYCAYNAEYSCPIVPAVNHLELAVTAGVRAYRPKKNP